MDKGLERQVFLDQAILDISEVDFVAMMKRYSVANLISDENLAEYYRYLEIVVKGKLFDFKRLIVIWNMNIGRYDHLIDAYLTTRK